MSSLPTGTLTFLFTDIAGSTQLWDRQHLAMKTAHARQADLIAEAVEAHRGHLVRSRGEGDSTFSVFSSPIDALAAAAALQCALHAETWPTDIPIRVRAALHVGPVEMRDGDYNATAVNRCARLRSLAVGGQTLVSQAVAMMAEHNLPSEVTLRSLGTHGLKDLERPEEIFQLCHPDLFDDFPPLRSMSALPTNLPHQLNRFIGREAEIAQLTGLLHPTDRTGVQNADRLVTLLGPGGAGKTRLSLQVGAELLEEYPDGVWLIELAALAEPSLLPQAIATTLRVREEPGRPLPESLREHLRPRTLLLILDNCEHLVEACARLLETLLRTCPHLRCLATSREALHIPGEQVRRLASLSLPPAHSSLSAAEVLEYEAPRLFCDRALQVKTDFTVTQSNTAVLAELCRHLDGIPLAIELAAVRVRSLSLPEIHDRLDQRFRLLTGGSRTALPRQQTLRALIDWSYDLLNAQERTLLARLSVFAGGWTLEAAETVCADDRIEDWEVLDLLSGLVDKSLALAEERQGMVRYRMLETIGHYGTEKLRESSEATLLRERHRDFFLTFTAETQVRMNGPEQATCLERLETEHDNLRQALQFCWETPGEALLGLRMAGTLQQFWVIRAHYTEARRYLDTLLGLPEAQTPTSERALALNGAGVLAYYQQDYQYAQERFTKSLEIRRDLQDTPGIARSLNNMGLIARAQNDNVQAQALYEDSLAAMRALNDRIGISACLYNLGLIAHDRSDFTRARTLFEESLAIRRELGEKHGIAASLNAWGRLERDQGDYALANSLYGEALAIWRELGDRKGIANGLNNLAGIATAQGDYAQSRRKNEESLAIRQELGDREGIAMSYNNMANSASAQGEYEEARSLYERSIAIKQEQNDRRGIATSLRGLGAIAHRQGHPARALSLFHESLTLQDACEDRPEMVATLEALAALCQEQGDVLRAARVWGVSEQLQERYGIVPALAHRPEHDRQVALAVEAADPAAFQTAWAEGKTMPPTQALELAQEPFEGR